MKHLVAIGLVVSLGALAGCPQEDGSGVECEVDCTEPPVKPTIQGADYFLLQPALDAENLNINWSDWTAGDCTFFDPCPSEDFTVVEVSCDGCIVETPIHATGTIRWLPALGSSSRSNSGNMGLRVTPLTVGDKTLRMVLRSLSTENVVETVEHRFTVDRVVSISGTCFTGPHRDDETKIVVTPCQTTRVAGDSLYVRPTLHTERGRALTEFRFTDRVEMSPAPTRRVPVTVIPDMRAHSLGEYQNPAAALGEVTLSATYEGRTFTAKVALPPGQ